MRSITEFCPRPSILGPDSFDTCLSIIAERHTCDVGRLVPFRGRFVTWTDTCAKYFALRIVQYHEGIPHRQKLFFSSPEPVPCLGKLLLESRLVPCRSSVPLLSVDELLFSHSIRSLGPLNLFFLCLGSRSDRLFQVGPAERSVGVLPGVYWHLIPEASWLVLLRRHV